MYYSFFDDEFDSELDDAQKFELCAKQMWMQKTGRKDYESKEFNDFKNSNSNSIILEIKNMDLQLY